MVSCSTEFYVNTSPSAWLPQMPFFWPLFFYIAQLCPAGPTSAAFLPLAALQWRPPHDSSPPWCIKYHSCPKASWQHSTADKVQLPIFISKIHSRLITYWHNLVNVWTTVITKIILFVVQRSRSPTDNLLYIDGQMFCFLACYKLIWKVSKWLKAKLNPDNYSTLNCS